MSIFEAIVNHFNEHLDATSRGIESLVPYLAEASNLLSQSLIEEKKIVGMLTLKDLMKHQIDSLTDEIHQLKDYIADLHEAGQD